MRQRQSLNHSSANDGVEVPPHLPSRSASESAEELPNRYDPDSVALNNFDQLEIAFKVIIPDHEVSGCTTNGRLKDLVVIRIAADLEVARDLDNSGPCCDEPDEGLRVSARIFEPPGQSRPAEDFRNLGDLRK